MTAAPQPRPDNTRSLRVLIVSGYFPPFAPMSGVRAGKLAKHLLAAGHDVRVLGARDLPFPPLLKPEIPAEKIHYAPCMDINALPKRIAALRRGSGGQKPAAQAAAPATPPAAPSSPSGFRALLRKLSMFYTELTNWPDPQIGWLPGAVKDGTTLLSEFRADLIYATVPPLTGLLVARRLAKRFGIPWVAEFRDLWVDHPYYDAPAWRRPFELRQQNRVLGETAAIVTVSDEWRDLLERRFHKPTATILNGFDPDDFPVEPPGTGNRPELTILYTGTLYPGRRDPTPLFHAMRQLGERRHAIRVHFYGADAGEVKELASKAGVEELVQAFAPVGYARAVQLQREADILLLLRWNDPSERGVVPGKLFEYAGARRPVLSLGFTEGAVPDIIRANGLGLVSEDTAEIAAALRGWLDEKARNGHIAPLPLAARNGLSRTDQFRKLEDFLHGVVAAKRSGAP
jgi:glycosyltransferase involved in cell wall biosynthesis